MHLNSADSIAVLVGQKLNRFAPDAEPLKSTHQRTLDLYVLVPKSKCEK